MFDLSGKFALVTGGSRGIGAATALSLAAQGAHVAVGYLRGEEAAAEVVSKIEIAGGSAEKIKIDAGEFAGTEKVVAELAKKFGQLDILVVSAGIALDGLTLRLSEDDLDKTILINLKGAIAAAKAATKVMMKKRVGRIIFISSVVGETGNAGQLAYSASKAGLLGVTKTLAREFATRNITVNAVTPGYIATDMTAALNDNQQKAMLSGVPLNRAGTPDEIGATISFLASDEAAYITGQAIRVNGGMYM